MKFKGGKLVKYILSLALAAVLVWFAFRNVDWAAFWDGLKGTRWSYVFLFLLTSAGALIFRTLRWKALLKPLGDCAPTLTVWDANNVGNLANVAVPATGEFVRCGYVTRGKASYDKVLGTVVMERIWDIAVILVMFAIALTLCHDRFSTFFAENIWGPVSGSLNFSLWWIIAGVVLLTAGFIWSVFHWRESNSFCRKTADLISGLGKGFTSFIKVERKWIFFACTVGIWVMYILMCWSILKAMPSIASLGFADAMFLCAVGSIASVIPVPGGIGAYHYLVALSLSGIYGANWETGILFATLQHEMHAVLIIVLGIISYINLTLKSKKK